MPCKRKHQLGATHQDNMARMLPAQEQSNFPPSVDRIAIARAPKVEEIRD
jgi:hypothetical protein